MEKYESFLMEFAKGKTMVLSSSLQNERLFVVKPMYVERWVYIDGVPFMEIFDVENQEYKLTKYEGV